MVLTWDKKAVSVKDDVITRNVPEPSLGVI